MAHIVGRGLPVPDDSTGTTGPFFRRLTFTGCLLDESHETIQINSHSLSFECTIAQFSELFPVGVLLIKPPSANITFKKWPHLLAILSVHMVRTERQVHKYKIYQLCKVA